MALLNDAIGPRGAAPDCRAPTLEAEPDTNAIVANQIKLLAAAMMCGATRVASVLLGFSEGYDVRHTQHHDEICYESTREALFDGFGKEGKHARSPLLVSRSALVAGSRLSGLMPLAGGSRIQPLDGRIRGGASVRVRQVASALSTLSSAPCTFVRCLGVLEDTVR
jgi:hypothetical protein